MAAEAEQCVSHVRRHYLLIASDGFARSTERRPCYLSHLSRRRQKAP